MRVAHVGPRLTIPVACTGRLHPHEPTPVVIDTPGLPGYNVKLVALDCGEC